MHWQYSKYSAIIFLQQIFYGLDCKVNGWHSYCLWIVKMLAHDVSMTCAAFTHACLTTRNRTKSLYKSIFVLSRSRNLWFIKRISLFKLQIWNLSLKTLEIRFNNRQVSFLVVKTVKCKRGISFIYLFINPKNLNFFN